MKDLFIADIENNSFQLLESEYHHCMRVTRHRIGDEILVTDFSGTIWNAVIQEDKNNVCTGIIHTTYKEEPAVKDISIGISLTHSADRFEWFVEKSVEIGVHHIYPLVCNRTETRKCNMERLHKIIVSASKQTHRALKPTLHEPATMADLFKLNIPTQRYICHCEGEIVDHLAKKYNPNSNVLILIGPAGDFDKAEIQFALDNGCTAVSLGEYRLRTETAGLSALQICQTIRTLHTV